MAQPQTIDRQRPDYMEHQFVNPPESAKNYVRQQLPGKVIPALKQKAGMAAADIVAARAISRCSLPGSTPTSTCNNVGHRRGTSSSFAADLITGTYDFRGQKAGNVLSFPFGIASARDPWRSRVQPEGIWCTVSRFLVERCPSER
jgi:hypothetical protein